jgi:hypothetical protein
MTGNLNGLVDRNRCRGESGGLRICTIATAYGPLAASQTFQNLSGLRLVIEYY